jgi:lysophospholipase L1-like esterase
MKVNILPFIAGLVVISLHSTAQAPVTRKWISDTTTNLPDHYVDRVRKFRQEPVFTNRMMFLGNSITEMGNWGKLIGDSSVVNRGIGGDNTYGILARLDDVITRKPSKLFLLIGINDISKDIPEVVIADNIRKIIARVQRESSQTRIYLESILPVNPDIPGFPQHYDKNDHIVYTNKLLRQLAQEAGIGFIDTYSIFNDGSGKLRRDFTGEGLHINQAGYVYWVKYLGEKGYL